MTATITHIVRCPVCLSDGEMIRHDIRAALVYSCLNCSHEWQIDPAHEPLEGEERDPAVAEPAQMPPASTKRPRKR
jgi:hypothetical protein